ncbi:MAG: thiamine diphosphokinase [Candidatus Marinimicrobia bacterium]|nr:thiamine diphosphokinase [Candidatus Neomarinimicrobiota bacterium]|tara:strand:- start:663 stop:1289 length:627 start_codon:yes stop_codon:yes gene_type:complete
MLKINKPLVIVANGEFPKNSIGLNILKKAKFIICCDGAADKLLKNGYTPNLIIGDFDSISEINYTEYRGITLKVLDQSKNDLRKAIDFSIKNNINELSIIGASGFREDHLIGNIFSLYKYPNTKIKIFTDTGTFQLINKSQKIKSFKGQQVSFFLEDKTIKITSSNLKYNFNKSTLNNLFSGTLNESKENYFNLEISHGTLLLYKKYK